MVPLWTPENKSPVHIPILLCIGLVVRLLCPTSRLAKYNIHILVVYTCLWLSQNLLNLPYSRRELRIGDGLAVLQPAVKLEEIVDIFRLFLSVTRP